MGDKQAEARRGDRFGTATVTAINGLVVGKGSGTLLGSGYTDLTVLSIAANGKDMSFSSDTGMAECLVIARKVGAKNLSLPPRAQFASLRYRPHGVRWGQRYREEHH